MPGYPNTYCADISLDPSKYNDVAPIHAVASVDWSTVAGGPDTYFANAVQTRVNGTTLTACVYIVGGNGRSSLPRAMWFAYQNNAKHRTNGTMNGRNIPFSTKATSATLCGKLPVRQLLFNLSIECNLLGEIFVGRNHSSSGIVATEQQNTSLSPQNI